MEDIDEKMIELWQKGHTAKHIANELGLTRNAIAGKLHRFKISGRIEKKNVDERLLIIKEQSRKENAGRSPELTKQKVPDVSLYKIEDKLIPLAKVNTEPVGNLVNLVLYKEAPAPVGKPIKFEQLTSKSCRYVINSGSVKDFLFCGQPKERGAYCEGHAKLCYYTLIRKPKSESEAKSS
jgi:hypothetical protein